MTENRIVIFSNGIADFRRSYRVSRGAETKISIPVRKDHVGDVLASLNVYGPVVLKSPPAFRPANELEGSISLDPQNALENLATSLSGSRVTVGKPGGSLDGVLVGLHKEPQSTGGQAIQPKLLVLMTEAGLKTMPLKDVQHLQFLDEAVRTEIAKALERSFQGIKPHSTFIELALGADEDDAEALLQYTIPAAAWKISYRLRETDGRFELQGFAIVDNNTDEDWNEFRIAVVTGEPMTFSTDLADSKVPRRKHVNVVKDTALGGIEVEQADFEMVESAMAMYPSDAVGGTARSRREPAPVMARSMAAPPPSAALEQADVRDVGDFCVFESKSPVTLAANRSAVVPIFTETLEKSQPVLHYKTESHPERPFRAVEFTNETAYSLGRGVCTVYQQGTYAGSCLMPALKPGEDHLLPHAVETGVGVRTERQPRRQRTVGLRLSAGYCYSSVHHTQETLYRVKNNKTEEFTLLLDHDLQLSDPKIECTLRRAGGEETPLEIKHRLKSGVRLSLALAPGQELAVGVRELQVQQAQQHLIDLGPNRDQFAIRWIESNLVHSNGPLADDPGVRKSLALQQALDRKQQETNDAVGQIERLTARQERLRQNISAGGDNEQTVQWRVALGQAEDEINELEEQTILRLRKEEQAIKDELRNVLRSLAVEWSAE